MDNKTLDIAMRLYEATQHPRFVSITKDESVHGGYLWQMNHQNDNGDEAAINSGNLCNLLTTWETLTENWAPAFN